MTIKADKWIKRMSENEGMIEPYEPGQVREANGERIVSYGTSSYGYDVRCADEFKKTLLSDHPLSALPPADVPEPIRRRSSQRRCPAVL